ncbi:MAG: acyltransferase [Pirellulales bacterium]|nr:acyltransferase [Pirellulales bacterium]
MPIRQTTRPTLRGTALPPAAVSWLDLVRALSAQVVVLAHLELLHRFEANPFLLPPLASIAVVVFYILSGFLIGRTLLLRYTDADYDFVHFLIDRFCRIYPAYLAALVFIALIDYAHRLYYPQNYHIYLNGLGDYSYTVANFIATALMVFKTPFLTSLVGPQNLMIFGSASQFWSLPVEWWLYMTVGYLVLTLKRKRFVLRDYALLLLFAYIPFFFMFQGNPVTGEGMAAVWLMGAIASFVYNACRVDLTKKYVRNLIAVAALLLCLTTLFRYQISGSPYDALGAFNLTALFLVSLWLVQHPWGSILSSATIRRLTRFLASYAYSLYLTHYSLVGFLNNFSLPAIIKWLLCNAFAVWFAYRFEVPHHRWAAKLHAWRARRILPTV